jgi:hypothetical protein
LQRASVFKVFKEKKKLFPQVHRFSPAFLQPNNLQHFVDSHLKGIILDNVAFKLNWNGIGNMGLVKFSSFALIQSLRGNNSIWQSENHF